MSGGSDPSQTMVIPTTINNFITHIEVSSSSVSIKLEDQNFQLWRREVVLALHERDLYEHVTGEEKRSDEKSTT
jgi:gag-polypeptide of LTR copia-type